MLVRSKALAVRVQTLANRSFLPLSQTGQCLFGPSFQDRFLATDLFLETVLFLSWSPTSGLTAVARNSQEDLLGCPKGARSGLEDHVIRPIPTPFKSIKNPDVVLTLARPNIGFWVSIVSMTSIPFDHLGSSNHIPSPTPQHPDPGVTFARPLSRTPRPGEVVIAPFCWSPSGWTAASYRSSYTSHRSSSGWTVGQCTSSRME